MFKSRIKTKKYLQSFGFSLRFLFWILGWGIPLFSEPTALFEPIVEKKIRTLIASTPKVSKKWEASGIYLKDDFFYIVFDNFHSIAKLKRDLSNSPENSWMGKELPAQSGFEGITFQPESKKFLITKESDTFQNQFKPVVHEYSPDFETLEVYPIDFPLKKANKGAEGIAYLKTKSETFILLLLEKPSTLNLGSKERGNILVLRKTNNKYQQVSFLPIPQQVGFLDYSDIAWNGSKFAILSQESSALWVGELDTAMNWKNSGKLYNFPLEEGLPKYCNLEGITWINENTVALVSDSAKKKQPPRCKEKSEMIHIWELKE